MLIVGQQIAKARTAKGMNQSKFALALGFKNKQTVSNWESGKSEPDTLTLVRISEVCGVTIDWLLKGEDAVTKVEQNVKNLYLSSATGSASHKCPTYINNSSPGDTENNNIHQDLVSTVILLNKKVFALEAEIKALKEENLRLQKLI